MKNEYKITKDLMRSWAREYHLQGAANKLLFALWCIVGGYGLLGLVAALSYHSDGLTIYLYALLVFIAVYKLFLARYVIWNRRYKTYSKTYGVSEWIRSYEFTEDEIVFADHTSVSRLKYENITGIKEKDNVVMIWFHDSIAIRLYKDAFVEGSWEECKAFLSDKMKK